MTAFHTCTVKHNLAARPIYYNSFNTITLPSTKQIPFKLDLAASRTESFHPVVTAYAKIRTTLRGLGFCQHSHA